MSIVEDLLNAAEQDHSLLQKNRERGDHPAAPRDLDFLLLSPNREQADLVASFVTDNRYGVATVEAEPDSTRWRVLVVVHAPATEHVVCSLSGLMVCIAELFKLEYDGWGCVLQPDRFAG
jgi:hypothetical protein